MSAASDIVMFLTKGNWEQQEQVSQCEFIHREARLLINHLSPIAFLRAEHNCYSTIRAEAFQDFGSSVFNRHLSSIIILKLFA